MIVRELVAVMKIKPDKKGMKSAASGMSKLVKLAGAAVGAFAAYKGVKWIKNTVTEVATLADTFDKMSKRSGISAEQLQRWDHAAQLSGATITDVEKGIVKLQRAQIEAADGTATYLDEFKRLGVTVKDSNGNFKDTEDLMLEMADAINKLPSDAEKTAVAMTLMGRSGTSLIPMFKEGSAGIKEMMNEMDEMGAVMGKTAIGEGANYIDTMRRVDVVMTAVKNVLAQELMPIVKDFAISLIAWWKINQDIVKVKVKEWAVKIGKALVSIGEALEWVGDNWGWLKWVGGALATLAATVWAVETAIRAYAAGVGIAKAITWLFNAAILANPMVAIIVAGIAVIAALVTALILVVKYWDDIVDALHVAEKAVEDFFGAIGPAVVGAWQYMVDFFEGIFAYFDELFSQSETLTKMFGAIGDFFGAGGGDINATNKIETVPRDGKLTGSGVTTNNTTTQWDNPVSIQIDAKNADAHEVAKIAKNEFDKQIKQTAQTIVPATAGA